MTDLSLRARKIILFLRDKSANEDVTGLEVNDIFRNIDDSEDMLRNAIEELSRDEFIMHEHDDTIGLTKAGFDYDLFSDGMIAEDVLRNGMG